MSAADRALIVQRFRLAATASVFIGAQLNESADRFADAIGRITPDDDEVFDDVIANVEGLDRDSYHPMMLAAEALAACLLRSGDYAPIVRRWARRPHPIARTAAVAVYAKAAEFDAGTVDFGTLAYLVARLDAAPSDDDDVTRGWLGRLACQLRDTDEGAHLIELMASRGAAFRIVAGYAIASDLSGEPPERHLEVLRARTPAQRSNKEPSRRFFWLFLSLLHDADPSVAQQARQALELIRTSWPDLWNRLVTFRGRTMAGPANAGDTAPPQERFVDEAEAAVAAALADLRARTHRDWTVDDLPRLTHRDLDRSADLVSDPPGVRFALAAPRESNMGYGVLTWDPEMLEEDQRAAAAGEEPIDIVGAPRLFLSYRWSHAVDTSGGIDYFAGALFNRGYDIVFDRDPRHLDERLTAYDVLLLMYGCTHFVPLMTDELVDFLAAPPRAQKTPIDLEMQLAHALAADGKLQWLPVRADGPRLPDELFATRRFQVIGTFDDGHREDSEPIERRQLRTMLAQARARSGIAGVEVRDVTHDRLTVGPAAQG